MNLLRWVLLTIGVLMVGTSSAAETPADKFKKILPAIELLLFSEETTVYNVYADHLNTPRLVTNQANEAVWRWENNDAFGANVANKNPVGLGNFEFNLRFAGQYFDSETNLHYNTFRDYDPTIGRYIQSDPLGLTGGVNLYAYALENPLSYLDPDGLNPILVQAVLRLLGFGAAATSVANDPVPILGRGMGGATATVTTAKTASSLANEICTGVINYTPRNPGPLASPIVGTFRSGTYSGGRLAQPTTMYRVIGPGGDATKSFWTTVPPTGPVASVIDSALLPQWGNNAAHVVTAKIPAGTQVYVGVAAPQGSLVGGGVQVYIPQVNPAWITGIQ